MSGGWNRSMLGYSGTGTRKSRQHARPHLNHRATPRLYSSLPSKKHKREDTPEREGPKFTFCVAMITTTVSGCTLARLYRKLTNT
jgi:hypothetical protein